MSQFQLARDEQGDLCLQDSYSTQKPLRICFTENAFLDRLSKAGKKSELVARAVKPRPGLRVLDCTAGLAKEACLLAYLGCDVTLLERSRVVGELIADGIKRASHHPSVQLAASRMSLRVVDAAWFLERTRLEFDVIYIDPMFPQKSGSAAVNGEMQILQRFLGVDEDAEALLLLALGKTASRVVLKRPPQSGWKAPLPPVHVFKGKTSCYEVYGG